MTTNTQEECTKIKVTEKSESVLNNLLNYFEKENPNNDLSYNWYLKSFIFKNNECVYFL